MDSKALALRPGQIRAALRSAGFRVFRAAIVVAGISLPALGAETPGTSSAWGHFFDLTNPFVSVDYTYDSNLLRLDDIVPAPKTRWDQYVTLGVGFSSNVQVSRQRFVVEGVYNPVWYDNYSEYNYNGGNAAAIWHWSGTETLTGTFGYRFRRSLRDFANEVGGPPPKNGRIKSIRTENRVLGTADYDLPDNWKLSGRGDYSDIAFTSIHALDLKRTSGGVTLNWVSHASNEIGIDFDVVNGNYSNAEAADFTEYSVGPVLKWKYSVRTQLTASAGYTNRHNKGRNPTTFGSPVYKLDFTIADAGRGSLTATAYRELSNLGDEIADYAVVDGVSIEPGWTLSNGLSVQVRGAYEHRDFETAAGSTGRLDDVGTLSGVITWPIGTHLKISGTLTTERRSSTRLYQDYEYLQQQLQIVGTF